MTTAPFRILHLLWAVALFSFSLTCVADDIVKIITLKHRLAAELAPTLEPFVDEQGVLTAKDNKLIIRTSIRNFGQIRELVEQLDRPLMRLLIEVRQPPAGSREARDIAGQPSLPDKRAETKLDTRRTASRDQATTDQRIQVLEGHSAVIKSGQLVPMARRQLRDGKAETVIEQQDISSGFSVTPHLAGEDTVLLEIAPFSASLDSSGGGIINRQQAFTTVSGKLGEWIEIGGTSSREQGQTRNYSTHERGERQRRILIKITILE